MGLMSCKDAKLNTQITPGGDTQCQLSNYHKVQVDISFQKKMPQNLRIKYGDEVIIDSCYHFQAKGPQPYIEVIGKQKLILREFTTSNKAPLAVFTYTISDLGKCDINNPVDTIIAQDKFLLSPSTYVSEKAGNITCPSYKAAYLKVQH